MSGAGPGDGREWRGRDPAGDAHVPHHAGKAILNFAGALGVQPGTFGDALLGSCIHCAASQRRCKHRPLVSERGAQCPQKSVGVR